MSDRIPPSGGTEYPWWAILDPRHITGPLSRNGALDQVAGMVTGPFLSREAAEAELTMCRHRYGPNAAVYCLSGYRSYDWRALCREEAP